MQYSIIIPIYGDSYLAEKCVDRIYKALSGLIQEKWPNTAFEKAVEIILVVDGQPRDLDALQGLPVNYPAVRILALSRNFGQHNAVSAGYEHARGEYIIRMNVDCQDPPEEIPRLIHEMAASGADQVIGVYDEKASSWLNRITSDLFYSFFNWLSGYKSPLNTAPLRLMTARYMRAYNGLSERNRFPQGLDEYLGFTKAYVTIAHHEREDRRSSYTFASRLRLAIEASISFSDRPMYIIIKSGFFVFIGGIAFFLYNLYNYFFIGAPISGYTTIVSLLVVFSASLYMAIGILGLYVTDVQREVKSRPYYLVKSKINFND